MLNCFIASNKISDQYCSYMYAYYETKASRLLQENGENSEPDIASYSHDVSAQRLWVLGWL